MPLAPCPDCGREVSTRARRCVNCGSPLRCCGICGGVKVFLLALLLIGGSAWAGVAAIRHHKKHEAKKAERLEMKKAEETRPAETDKKQTPPQEDSKTAPNDKPSKSYY